MKEVPDMRKTYSKPTFYTERFQLIEHISACNILHSAINASDPQNGCGYSLNGPNPGIDDPILFLMDKGVTCTDQGDLDQVDVGGVCYNYFMDEGTRMFGS